MLLCNCGQELRYCNGGETLRIEQAIKEYLKNHGIKQAFVAERCDWTKQRMNAILTGKQKISADDYAAICEAISVPYDYFYNAAARDSA